MRKKTAPTQNLEILAPAGNMELLHAAVDAGADSVYVGIKGMSARPDSWGFDIESAKQASQTIHNAGRHIYFALNAEYAEYRANQFIQAIQMLDDGYADAFIVSDWGLLKRLCKMHLNHAVHASTLLGVYNINTAQYLKDLGVARVILNTNLYLDEISQITLGCPELEYEVIAYGGICFNDSHRCRLPHFTVNGKYFVGCGMDYQVSDGRSDKSEVQPGCIHMPDIDLSSTLKVYTELGIYSFKIEGRTRPKSYVYESIGALRQAITRLQNDPEKSRAFHYLADLNQERRAH
jgi:U32 family peptidase